VLLTPTPLERQEEHVESLADEGCRIAVDPHEPISPRTRSRWLALLRHADAFFVSRAELQLEGDPIDVLTGLASEAGGRLDLVAVKHAEQGGHLLRPRSGAVVGWQARASRVVDPTGAGDAFAGGFLAATIAGASIERALRCAVISASFAMEEWGAAGLLAATPDDAERRLREWYA
jgi:sugar/nucleoside kinase (ribokinase family)